MKEPNRLEKEAVEVTSQNPETIKIIVREQGTKTPPAVVVLLRKRLMFGQRMVLCTTDQMLKGHSTFFYMLSVGGLLSL